MSPGWQTLNKWGSKDRGTIRDHETRAKTSEPDNRTWTDEPRRSDARSRQVGFAIVVAVVIGLAAYAFGGNQGFVPGVVAAAVVAGAILLLARFWR